MKTGTDSSIQELFISSVQGSGASHASAALIPGQLAALLNSQWELWPDSSTLTLVTIHRENFWQQKIFAELCKNTLRLFLKPEEKIQHSSSATAQSALEVADR